MDSTKFSASGKLLLFGEYLVLRGAKSLAIPLRYGQTLNVSAHSTGHILWKCFEKGKEWLQIEFTSSFDIIHASDEKKAAIVQLLLQFIHTEKPSLKIAGLNFHFEIDFDRGFGFGTSSTFLSLLSQWSGVNPYLLLEKSFGGSGFDIATATSEGPIIYKKEGVAADEIRQITPVTIPENIHNHLLFVYTGKKQRSRDEVLSFGQKQISITQIVEMNHIIDTVLRSDEIDNFERQMKKSEKLLSTILWIPALQSNFFSDYPYAIKSLGAWGGDFIMATFRDEAKARNYFSEKGMNVTFNYQQLIRS